MQMAFGTAVESSIRVKHFKKKEIRSYVHWKWVGVACMLQFFEAKPIDFL